MSKSWCIKNCSIIPNLLVNTICLRSVIYPSKISDKATPCPLWFFLFVTLATTLLAFVQSHHLLNLHPLGAPSIGTFIGNDSAHNFRIAVKICDFYLYSGIGLSVGGAWINNYHDGLLTSLRGRGQGYQIPSGGLFDLVSCANYFGEVLEWCGWACVTRGGSPQVGVANWVVFLSKVFIWNFVSGHVCPVFDSVSRFESKIHAFLVQDEVWSTISWE